MAKKKAKVSKKKASKVVKKAVKKAPAKKKVAAKSRRPVAKKKVARKTARPAARKAVKKAVKPAMKKHPAAKPKVRATPKRPPAMAAPRPPAPAPLPAPVVAPAAPYIPPPPPPSEPKDRGPRFFEPEDLPTSGGPLVEGPLLDNDRRDRPFYDTEAGRTDLDEEIESENGEHETTTDDFDEEEDAAEEDDDEGSPSRGRPPPRAQASSRGRNVAGAAIEIGSAAPDFELPDEQGRLHSLSAYRGRKVVVYFYPKDDTPGCTREACGFRDTLGEFDDRNAVVLGISPDSVASHASFVKKFGLTFPLLADANHVVALRYGAWGEKAAPGGVQREGMLRSTFVIDEAGRIAQMFRQVQPDGHEHQVLSWLDQNWLAGE